MADVLTATYKFTKPEVGGSDDTWGDKLNADLDSLDGLLTSSAQDETGFVTGSASVLGVAMRVAGTSPYVQWVETDATLPAGRYRLTGSAGSMFMMANTAAAGDFTTVQNVFSFSASAFNLLVPLTGFEAGGNAPQVQFGEADQVDPAGRYRFMASAGNFYFQKALTAAWATNEDIWTYGPATGLIFYKDVLAAAQFTSSGTSPSINLLESDMVDPAGRFRLASFADTLYCQRALTANWATSKHIWRYNGATDAFFLDAATVSAVGNIASAGNISAANISASARVSGQLQHDINAGYGYFGAYSTGAYGNGYMRWHVDYTNRNLILGSVDGAFGNAGGNFGITASRWSLDGNSGDLRTDGQATLAQVNGTVNIGYSGGANLTFQRSLTPFYNYITVPNTGVLRVQNASAVAWASINSASGWTAGSDARMKQNVVDIPYGLDTVLALRPVAFDWIEDSRHDIGLIAQEVELLVPEIVEEQPPELDEEGKAIGHSLYTLRKDALVAVLIRAVQELTARVVTLEGAT